MSTESSPPTTSTAMLWIGRVLSALPVLLLLVSGVVKLFQPPDFLKEFAKFGYPENVAFTLGIVEIVCTLLYAIPRTSTLGAILLTGYLGGAIATHVRIGDPFIPQAIFGVVIWLGLWLREPRLRAILPLRS